MSDDPSAAMREHMASISETRRTEWLRAMRACMECRAYVELIGAAAKADQDGVPWDLRDKYLLGTLRDNHERRAHPEYFDYIVELGRLSGLSRDATAGH